MERKWWTLIAVSVAIFMLLLDITVVNVALPSIQSALKSSFSDLQWVVNAYALTLAAFLLTAGSVADLIGRRRVFVLGLIVFTLSSAVCGLSTTPLMLNLARAVQGVGGAMMFATSLALLAQAFHGRERGTAFGVFGAVTGAAVAIGPGRRRDHHLWHRLGVDLLHQRPDRDRGGRDHAVARRGVERPQRAPRRLDRARHVLGRPVRARVRPDRGQRRRLGLDKIVSLLLGALVLFVAFITAELKQSRPMLDLSLFRKPAFTGASIVAFSVSASIFAMFLYLTLYIQDVLGYTALQAGLRFLPITLLSFVAAPIAGRLSVRMPVRYLLGGGLLLVGAGLLGMTAIDSTSGWTTLIPGFAVTGVGIGLINPPLASTAIGVVHYSRSGMASGINSTFRQVGIATGIAGLGAVFQHDVLNTTTSRLGGQLPAVQAAAHGHLNTLLQSGEVKQVFHVLSPAAQLALKHSYRVGFTEAFDHILIIAAAIAFVGAVCALVLVRQKDFVASQAPAETPSEGLPAGAEPQGVAIR